MKGGEGLSVMNRDEEIKIVMKKETILTGMKHQ